MSRIAQTARALALAGIVIAATAHPASAQADNPPGNNGHIQIDEYDMDGGNGNDPHVACGMSVTFFGYDAGDQQATITVTPWAPTDGGTAFTQSASWHTDERTSGNQLDANVKIAPAQVADAFAGVAPAHQGWHAKIEVHVTGSRGADVKHKVVWITPCPEAATALGGPASAAPSPAPEAATGDAADVLGVSVSRPGTGTGIAPATAAVAVSAVPTTAG